MTITVDRQKGLSGGLAIKAPVRVATTANISLAGLQTIDGVTLVAGDRVLVKDQTDAVDNGIWDATTSSWSRALDFNGSGDIVQGTVVPVVSGTVSAGFSFKVTTEDPIVGTSEIAFSIANDFSLRAELANPSNGTGVDLVAGAGRVVETIADLKALDSTYAKYAVVLGGTSKGDLEGGAYYYDSTDTTSAETSRTIIVGGDGARWKLVQNGVASDFASTSYPYAKGALVRSAGALYLSLANGNTASPTDETKWTPFLASSIVHAGLFGATGDDATNNTVSLQSAFDYCAANGKALYIPSGVYRYNTLSLTGAPIAVIGEGRYQSILKTTTTTGACITLATGGASITGIKIRSVGFASVSSRTTGATIDFQSATGAFFATELENLWFSPSMSGGISIYGAAFVTMLDNILIDYVAAGNQGLRFEGTSRPSSIIADLRLNNIAIRAGAGTGSGIGLQIVDMVDGVYANQVSAEGGLGYGLSIGKTSGGDPIPPRDHWYTQCVFDYSVNIGVYLQSGQNLNFTDCWSSSNSATGVDIGALVVGAKLDGLKAFANALGGIAVQTGADSVQILNSTLVGNSSVANTYSDIEIKAGVSNFQIKNNMFYRAGATKSSRYNINVVAGASDDYMITGNTCTGYLTAGVFDGGTGVNKVVADNLS